MSDEMGVAKPDARFFARALELMGVTDAASVAYVGDRPDNDVRPSAAAGMRAVWLRRGPWGVIAVDAPEAVLRVDSLTELVDRLDEVLDNPRSRRLWQPCPAHLLPSSALPVRPVRSIVRATVANAWAAAGVPEPCRRSLLMPRPPSSRCRTPSDPAHGDVASSVGTQTRPAAAPPADGHRGGHRGRAADRRRRRQSARRRRGRRSRVPQPARRCRVARAHPRRGPCGRGGVRAADPGIARVIDVEFVSANPTGPLTVGNARGAFVGDLLCRVLEAAGDQVTREYYFNDSGRQVRVLGASVAARRAGEELPEEAYRGAYVDALAEELPDAIWAAAIAPDADRESIVGAWASERIRCGYRGQPRASGCPLRRLDQRGVTAPLRAGSSAPWSVSGPVATCSSRTARPGSGRRRSAMTRTGSSTAPPASQRTSRPTSAT